MTSDPEQLARGLAAGSTAAWHQLYDAHCEAVWRCVARRVGPHRAEVADIVQETFLAAARSARTFDPARGSLWAWLSGIARRQAALYFRRKQTRPEAGDGDDVASAVGNALRGVPCHANARNATEGIPYRDNSEPADLLALAETAQSVRHVLRGLSIDYETLLVGKYMDGLSLDELAASEGATIDAVSSKLARARRAFREAFERQEKLTRRASEDRLTRSVSEESAVRR
jgi:RNA polymerase sigma-70 factor (ECF subfamily)